MVSRRYLRIKVMQALYAKKANANEDLASGEKKLDQSIQRCQELSFYFYSIFPIIRNYVDNKLSERKNKNFPTEEDLNPNTKFVDNLVIKQIDENKFLQSRWKELGINWYQQTDLIAKIFSEIMKLEKYQTYMAKPARSYKSDKELILAIITEVFAENELLHWFFEEKYVHWFDDYNEALLMVYQNITFWKASQEQVTISPLLKDPTEDTLFYKNLYRKTIENWSTHFKEIESKLQNWESDRVIETDMILMQMAMCELTEFSDIPVKVTINEYIEIAKMYSSAKSANFINGMIDRLANELKMQGKLNKSGRGLLNQSLKPMKDE